MSSALAWIRSARLASQSYIALPIWLGMGLCYARTRQLLPWETGLLVAFGIFDQLYIVWGNDLADQETDRHNQTATIFSGGSRVLVEGALSPAAIGRAWALAAAGVTAVSLALAGLQSSLWPALLGAAALLLLWLYSYPPVRLSYRGGGELLQMLGVGLVLPILGFVAQGGALAELRVDVVLAMLPGQLACAIATTLPDEPSDRGSNKRTVAVRLGVRGAALLSSGLAALSLGLASRTGLVPGALSLGLGAVLVSQLSLHRARPGSFELSARVFLLLTAVLGTEAALVYALFAG